MTPTGAETTAAEAAIERHDAAPVDIRARAASLDLLRAVGAFGVVAVHTLIALPNDVTNTHALAGVEVALGYSAVSLFFAVSGLLVGGPFVLAMLRGEMPDLTAYAARRAARIAPAAWLAFAGAVAVAAVVGDPTPGGRSLLTHFLFVNTLVPGETYSVISAAWTLGIEASFYVALPVVAALVIGGRRRPLAPDALVTGMVGIWAAGGLGLIALAAALKPGGRSDVLTLNVFTLAGLFVAGMTVAAGAAPEARGSRVGALVTGLARRPVRSLAMGVAIVLASAAVNAAFVSQTSLALVYVICSVASVPLLAGLLGTDVTTSRAGRTLATIGLANYGIYLWHGRVLRLLGDKGLLPSTGHVWFDWPVDWLIVLAVAVPIGWASWQLVERPAMLAARRLVPARRTRRAEAHPQPVADAEATAPAGVTGP